MQKDWQSIKSALKNSVPFHSYRMWIEPLTVCRDENGDICIECPNAFSLRRVQDHYSEMIRAEFERLTGQT